MVNTLKKKIKMTKQMTVYVGEKTYKDFKQEAKNLDRSLNWLMKKCMVNYLDSDEKKKFIAQINEYENLQDRVNQLAKRNIFVNKEDASKEKLTELLKPHIKWGKETKNRENYMLGRYTGFIEKHGDIIEFTEFEKRIKNGCD